MRYTPENITSLKPGERFVFGSNLAGRHGKGAALIARKKFGAEAGKGAGQTGLCYAIPTKDKNLKTLPLDSIRIEVMEFVRFASRNQHIDWLVTKIGCGLAGYSPEEIAPFFSEATSNVILPEEFERVIHRHNDNKPV